MLNCGFRPAKLQFSLAFPWAKLIELDSLGQKKSRPKAASKFAVSTKTTRLPARPKEDYFVLRFAKEVNGVNEFVQNLKFEAWSDDPVIRQAQIELAFSRRAYGHAQDETIPLSDNYRGRARREGVGGQRAKRPSGGGRPRQNGRGRAGGGLGSALRGDPIR